ncbi:MAG TPA: hypothetical protein VM120_25700 [Bryobacteraceae bacterium]|nr:hypothetical protein [Bryobacteraceae bacterium]
MRCLYCRRGIGTLRHLVDREFCSSEHRKRFRTTSARAARDASEMLGDYEDYLALIEPPEKKLAKNAGSRFGLILAGTVGLIVGLCLWIVPSTPVPMPSADLRYALGSNPISQVIRSWIPDTPKINLRQDFRMGPGDWLGALNTPDAPGALRTDHLRLWKPTLRLSDYQMEFQTSIERKAVGWAFRASDLGNYYGTKITVGSKDGRRAEVERFVVVMGREFDRVRLPIPVSIRADTLYRVRMRVRGDQFSTSVDGQIIDAWRDRRLNKGGVGFFAERGEQATVRWVSLSEPDGFFSRLLAMGFFVHPIAMMAGMPGYGLPPRL